MEDEIKDVASKLLCTRQVAEILSVSPAFLNKLRSKGGGPVFVRVGRAVRYRQCDLETWVSRNRRANTASQSMACAEGV